MLLIAVQAQMQPPQAPGGEQMKAKLRRPGKVCAREAFAVCAPL